MEPRHCVTLNVSSTTLLILLVYSELCSEVYSEDHIARIKCIFTKNNFIVFVFFFPTKWCLNITSLLLNNSWCLVNTSCSADWILQTPTGVYEWQYEQDLYISVTNPRPGWLFVSGLCVGVWVFVLSGVSCHSPGTAWGDVPVPDYSHLAEVITSPAPHQLSAAAAHSVSAGSLWNIVYATAFQPEISACLSQSLAVCFLSASNRVSLPQESVQSTHPTPCVALVWPPPSKPACRQLSGLPPPLDSHSRLSASFFLVHEFTVC